MGHHELAILVPVLRRPHRVKPLLESIHKATPVARVLFICDPDDAQEIDAVAESSADGMLVAGNYATKINRGVAATNESLLLFGADDVHFHPGWLEAAQAKLTDGIGVVGTNDLCNPRTMQGQLATHPLVTREYAERGAVDDSSRPLHEGYLHEFVDQEFTETAIKRSAFAYAPDAIVEHLHPDVGKAPMDDLYAAQKERMVQGRKVYNQRKHLWT